MIELKHILFNDKGNIFNIWFQFFSSLLTGTLQDMIVDKFHISGKIFFYHFIVLT